MDRSRVFYVFIGIFAACAAVMAVGVVTSSLGVGTPRIHLAPIFLVAAVWGTVAAVRRRQSAND